MTGAPFPAPHIAYLVPDLTDPAVERRRIMFRAGGAQVSTAGFHRRALTPDMGDVVGLGQTFDADFKQRMLSVAKWALKPGRLRQLVSGSNVVVARNLEMLLLARLALVGRPAVPLIYECLDIHRLMLGSGVVSNSLRRLEGWLLRRVSRVIVSSPAFERNYFRAHFPEGPRLVLVENRMLGLDHTPQSGSKLRDAGGPWVIGWFGMIRCRRSLSILASIAGRSGGAVEVVIRGRPTADVFSDLASEVAAMPGVRFEGPYTAADLATIYSEVDFVWALDFFEAGLNSSWLLPNRLYEGGAFDRPVIAQAGVETARWLSARHAGVILTEPETDLKVCLDEMSDARYQDLVATARAVPRNDLICDRQACRNLVKELCEGAL